MSPRARWTSARARAAGRQAGALLLALGCHRSPTAATLATPAATSMPVATFSASAGREWAETRAAALELMTRGEHARADSLLNAFRDRYPGTPASADALLWRGLVRADPSNRAQATREAAADLQAYESGGALHAYAAQSAVVRRLLAQIDSLQRAVVAERTAAAALVPRDSLKPRDDELLKLREELEQTRAELERVRRRLAPPRLP